MDESYRHFLFYHVMIFLPVSSISVDGDVFWIPGAFPMNQK